MHGSESARVSSYTGLPFELNGFGFGSGGGCTGDPCSNLPQNWRKLEKKLPQGVQQGEVEEEIGTLEECKEKCLDGTWFGCLGFSRYRSAADATRDTCFWVAEDKYMAYDDDYDGVASALDDDNYDLYVHTCTLAPCSQCEAAGFLPDACGCGTCGSDPSYGCEDPNGYGTCNPTNDRGAYGSTDLTLPWDARLEQWNSYGFPTRIKCRRV